MNLSGSFITLGTHAVSDTTINPIVKHAADDHMITAVTKPTEDLFLIAHPALILLTKSIDRQLVRAVIA